MMRVWIVAMNLKFLRTFVTIADNAGFARAATQLNLTQSAASRQIQALEEELGMLLFVRVGRSSRLTPEGEDLLLRSLRLLSDVEARGVDGRQIQIIPYDNKSSSADSVRAFQRAVSDDKVNCDLGRQEFVFSQEGHSLLAPRLSSSQAALDRLAAAEITTQSRSAGTPGKASRSCAAGGPKLRREPLPNLLPLSPDFHSSTAGKWLSLLQTKQLGSIGLLVPRKRGARRTV
jgi:hypothetical protein